MIAIDDIRALFHPDLVIAACGLDAKRRGRAWRMRTCPFCGAKPSRQGCAIYRRKSDGQWRATHHGHSGCAGDMLDVLAAHEGIDRRRDFSRLVEVAAKLVGITPSDPHLERRLAVYAEADRARREQEERARAAALAEMSSIWNALPRRSLVGERYLQSRGFDVAELRAQGDILRFTESGEIALPLRHLETGTIVGIQHRSAGGKDFRMAEWSEPSESALVGRVSELDREGVDVAVIVEGLADTLAARLAFPGCAVFGAAGADHLEHIAATVAKRVLEIGGWMMLTVDNDATGKANTADAVLAAIHVGLRLDRDLHLIDLGEHHDLADAWNGDWRWQWPSENGGAA